MTDMNKKVIEEFRTNDGKVGGYFANSTLLLLHTIGAKSGKERINPLVTIEDGDRLVVAASKGGAPTNPDWYYNIVANPLVDVEFGAKKYQAQATITSEPERTELYDKLASAVAGFAQYEEQTTRVIPIVTLAKVD